MSEYFKLKLRMILAPARQADILSAWIALSAIIISSSKWAFKEGCTNKICLGIHKR